MQADKSDSSADAAHVALPAEVSEADVVNAATGNARKCELCVPDTGVDKGEEVCKRTATGLGR